MIGKLGSWIREFTEDQAVPPAEDAVRKLGLIDHRCQDVSGFGAEFSAVPGAA